MFDIWIHRGGRGGERPLVAQAIFYWIDIALTRHGGERDGLRSAGLQQARSGGRHRATIESGAQMCGDSAIHSAQPRLRRLIEMITKPFDVVVGS